MCAAFANFRSYITGITCRSLAILRWSTLEKRLSLVLIAPIGCSAILLPERKDLTLKEPMRMAVNERNRRWKYGFCLLYSILFLLLCLYKYIAFEDSKVKILVVGFLESIALHLNR